MSTRSILVGAVFLSTMLMSQMASAGPLWDLGADFNNDSPLTQSEFGPWSLGHGTNSFTTFNVAYDNWVAANTLHAWLTAPSETSIPGIARTNTLITTHPLNVGVTLIDLPIGSIAVHPSSEAVFIRWTAPADMVVDISGELWEGFHGRALANSASLIVDGQTVFSTVAIPNDQSSSSPLSLSTAAGGNASLLNDVQLNAGDVIQLTIASNGMAEMTGLNFRIEQVSAVPEPNAFLLLALGTVGLTAYFRLRRRPSVCSVA